MARTFIPHTITDDSAIGGQVIQGSSIIDVASGSYMTRTATSGNRRTYTWAAWVKRQQDADKHTFMFAETDNDNQTSFGFNHSGVTPPSGFYFRSEASGTAVNATPNGTSRDFSTFYHVVFAVDTTQSSATDRIKFYLNGTLKSWSVNPPMSQNYETHINQNGIQQQLFAQDGSADLDAIISQVYFVDGQQLGPENFGYTESQTGIWRPKKYTGTYGTNGFYLPFDGSSHISKDMSGNGNDWTPHNMRCTVPLYMATGALPILKTNSGGTTACPGVRPDPLASNIVLALPLSDRSATAIGVDVHHLIKGSGTPKTLTNSGSIATNITQPHFYGRSGSINIADASSKRVEISTSNDFSMSTGDFTIECWIHPNSTSASDGSLFVTHDGSTYFALNFSPNTSRFNIYLNSGGPSWSPTAPEGLLEYAKWNHVALVKHSNVVKLYVNGLAIGSYSHSAAVGYTAASTTLCRIGGGGGSSVNSYMQDMRIYKGVAKYTDTFTCGSQDSTVIADSPSGVALSRKLDPPLSGSVGFEGTDSKLVAPHHTDLNATNQDFCFEAFIYPVGSTSNFGFVFAKGVALQIAWVDSSAVSRMTCYLASTGGGSYDIASDFNSGTGSVPMHQWSHFAFVRSSGTLKWYINGIEKASTSISGTIHANTDDFNVGAYSSTSYEFKGSISNARVTIGQAVYTSNFTTPTEPLTLTSQSVTSSNVKLLCCKDKFDESAVDKIPTGSLTVHNSAKATSFTPFLDDVDSRAGGYPVLNMLLHRKAGTVSEGNFLLSGSNYTQQKASVVFGPGNITTGKYYWEIENGGGGSYGMYTGITAAFDQGAGEIALQANKSWLGSTGYKRYNTTSHTEMTNLEQGTLSIALDVDNQVLRAYYNTRLIYTDTTIPNASTTQYAPFTHSTNDGASGSNQLDAHYNFGQRPFTFTPPEGYQSLGSANISPALVKITRPQKHFACLTYTGNQNYTTGQSITGLEFQPDLVWIKHINAASTHSWQDSIIGAGLNKTLRPDTTGALDTNGHLYGYLSSFDSNGFTVNSGNASGERTNGSGHSYVAWCWKAGGSTTVTNNEGSVTSQVSVNNDAGFSIVKWTGNSTSSTTIGHGLNQKPELIILKNTSGAENWRVYYTIADGSNDFMYLNTEGAVNHSGYALPTTSVWNKADTDGVNMMAYVWHSVPGYSKMGSYYGNGNTDGKFVYTGFRPAFILLKRHTDASNYWEIRDNKRNPNNTADSRLFPNRNDVASVGEGMDFYSNGFKIRNNGSGSNSNDKLYIYMAFAEQPAVNQYGAQSNAR